MWLIILEKTKIKQPQLIIYCGSYKKYTCAIKRKRYCRKFE